MTIIRNQTELNTHNAHAFDSFRRGVITQSELDHQILQNEQVLREWQAHSQADRDAVNALFPLPEANAVVPTATDALLIDMFLTTFNRDAAQVMSDPELAGLATQGEDDPNTVMITATDFVAWAAGWWSGIEV